MNKPLSKKEAAESLSLDDKTFDNYFQNADEFRCMARESGRGRYYFIKDDLAEWSEPLNGGLWS